MADDRKHLAPLDPGRVHLTDPEDLHYWCKELHCTETQLAQAVATVGSHIAAVREQLHAIQKHHAATARR